MPRPRSRKTRTRALPGKTANKLPAAAEAWVRSTHKKMTLEEKLGQLLMISFHGQFTAIESEEFRGLSELVGRHQVGGLILETRPGQQGIRRSQVYPSAALVNLLQARAKLPLLVGGDFERGTAMRLDEGTSFTHAMAIAATRQARDAYTLGRITALEARAVGVPWLFAPVADVNNDPDNPIINMRSFGENPARVSEFVAAFVRGAEDHGALATAKHFPGHGNTHVDSHLELPTVHSDRAHMERIELVPFRAAIAAGVSTVMTGHISVPALEPAGNTPATLSATISTGLLRERMGFRGLIVTDALNMGGVTGCDSPGEIAVRSILAGTDVLLLSAEPRAALAALKQAALSGRLSPQRIDESVLRILRAKARLGLHRKRLVDLDALPKTFALPEFARAAEDIAGRGMTLLRDTPRQLPLDATQPLRVSLVAIAGDPDRLPLQEFERTLRQGFDSLTVFRADTRFHPVADLTLPASGECDVLIVGLIVRYADRKGSIALPEDQVAFVRRLIAERKGSAPVIVVCFGSPYVIALFPEAQTWIAAFSTAEVAQSAAARALLGESAIGGRIPVTVPGAVTVGAGIDSPASPMTLVRSGAAMDGRLAPVYQWLDRVVAAGEFPGGALAVGLGNRVAIHAFGKVSFERKATAVKPDSIFDTASLTKPLVTSTLAAMLAEAGQIDLDAPVTRYLPEFSGRSAPSPRAGVTVRHLLTHTSGLPAHRKYYKSLSTKASAHDAVLSAALSEPLEYEPGAKSIYSDIGFILLGELIERITGMALDELTRTRIFDPLGMEDTSYRPAKSQLPRVIPVVDETPDATPLARGAVHDGNARAMGGVSGHAGAFSTVGDLAVFCQMFLNRGIYAHHRLLQSATVDQFTAAAPLSGNVRTLGWMAPTPDSSSGHYFSPSSYGHLGFTGTSMWIDPKKELFAILLTARINPVRDKIRELRAGLHDAIVEALELKKER